MLQWARHVCNATYSGATQTAYIHTYIHTYIQYAAVTRGCSTCLMSSLSVQTSYMCMYVMCAVHAMIPRYGYVYKHGRPTVVGTALCMHRKHRPVKFPPNLFLVLASAVGY